MRNHLFAICGILLSRYNEGVSVCDTDSAHTFCVLGERCVLTLCCHVFRKETSCKMTPRKEDRIKMALKKVSLHMYGLYLSGCECGRVAVCCEYGTYITLYKVWEIYWLTVQFVASSN
jgi:hypothetical protein